MINYSILLDNLLKGYQCSYDVERIGEKEKETSLVAKAHFHVEESQCVVFKEFSMWTAESDEHVFIFHTKRLTLEIAKQIIEYTYSEGFPLIKLEHTSIKHQHMCTRLVALVIAEETTPEAVKILKRCKIYKNFNFSLKGWMEMHTVAVNLETGQVTGNRYSRDTVRYIKELISHLGGKSARIKMAL